MKWIKYDRDKKLSLNKYRELLLCQRFNTGDTAITLGFYDSKHGMYEVDDEYGDVNVDNLVTHYIVIEKPKL